ncbi:cytochrome P450 [Nocardia carnea]|uniref:cytochrome P450 n=1 Tax=Nocardia carnea TaxID=37328 RepID=UPI002458441E|nr:cytochrome P450 [Nocardia carnea]
MYTEEFAADPHRMYRQMRQFHRSLVPVELDRGVPAYLVIGFDAAVKILNDPDRFPADPRKWQETLPGDSPIKSMVEYRLNALRNSGDLHARYRPPTVAALKGIDPYALHRAVGERAIPLINTFCSNGSAELMQQYAFPLVFNVLNIMMGCPDDVAGELVEAFAAMFDGGDADVINGKIFGALSSLIAAKRETPGDDVTTRLLAHADGFSDEELIDQLLTMYAAGIEPGVNLISNALRLILTDPRFAGDVLGGSLSVRAALDDVLFNDPPMANYCLTYPRQPTLVDDVWLPANEPVLVSIAACNTDPAIRGNASVDTNRAHLAFSAGPHTCPARDHACMIAEVALEQILDVLPELELACAPEGLQWRQGPFHRALAGLPVTFPPSPPLPI